MTRWTMLIETGLCGFGFSGGMVPEVRLGVVRVAATRGWISAHIRQWAAALEVATANLRNKS